MEHFVLKVDELEAGKMGKHVWQRLSVFDTGRIVMARRLGQSISKTAVLSGAQRCRKAGPCGPIQDGGGRVMLWAMFCWEPSGPAVLVDVSLTRTTYLSIVAGDVHPFMETVFDGNSGDTWHATNLVTAAVPLQCEWVDYKVFNSL